MKKIFIFIFLLFPVIFFSSCHDDGLSGIIDKSELKLDDKTTKVASTSSQNDEEKKPKSRLEELISRNPNLRKLIDVLNRTSERRSNPKRS
ncbi:hypothetical protein [Blattabacterium cuenoti]|uniref:hypothetical protein n=1 Tax=Blattabacterium cuenoti TaxID=1653831 RepID=UPI00163CCB7F|nr:hypothetical protein [Blattabacterium cuenoti]